MRDCALIEKRKIHSCVLTNTRRAWRGPQGKVLNDCLSTTGRVRNDKDLNVYLPTRGSSSIVERFFARREGW